MVKIFWVRWSRGGGSQIWSGYGCKARPPTGWGIRWEHRLKKWGVIGWEHDFWHSVREKYKNMWGHQVRAKSSQKSRVFGWYLKQSIVRVLPGILSDAGVVGMFKCQLFKSWGIEWQIIWKNMGLWVRAHATVKNMGSMGDSDAEKGGLLSLTYASPPEWDCPPPPPGRWCPIMEVLRVGHVLT